jgi:hypothetical protein
MRKVTLDISLLHLNVGDTVHISLVNSVGNKCVASNGFAIDTDFILDSPLFEIELLENENVGKISSYELSLASSLKLVFTVPARIDNTPHELLSLSRLGCAKGIIDKYTKKLSDDFVTKLDRYFIGEKPNFTPTQKAVVELYVYYADNVIETLSTIDIMQLMDEYLATIQGEI